MALSYTTTTQSRLQRLFDTCVIAEEKYSEVDLSLKQILKGKERYLSLSEKTNVPWYITGILHSTICECDFKTHLINGDSLNGRTTHIPTGFPKRGRPPFTWEDSATDAIQFFKMDKWNDWSIAGSLFNLELINGESLLLDESQHSKVWCFSNHYTPLDNNPLERCGSAILLRRMAEKKIIHADKAEVSRLAYIKKLGMEIQYMPHRSLPKVYELQRQLNLQGAFLREDGRAARYTANAYHAITNCYLSGDPEAPVTL